MATIKKRYTLLSFLMWISSICIGGQPFAQKVDYDISAALFPEQRLISAAVSIRYTNNSPDQLDSIFIHLWPNAYSNYETPFADQLLENGSLDFHFMKRKNLGYIDSLHFSVDGIQVPYALLPGQPDIAVVYLPTTLQPGESMEIRTPFRVKLPNLVSRAGVKDDIYVISQWFPKIAVYDANGWHPLSYLNQGEFYSEFGNYTVSLSVPSTFQVAATGLSGMTPVDTQGAIDTYHIAIDSVHDFCWAASKKYNLLTDKVILENNHEIEIRVYCKNTSAWQPYLRAIKTTLQKMSEWVGPYPYPVCTIVEGPITAGGGMEYPTITIIDANAGIGGSLEKVISHEIIHNWWYGILASNERAEPWIDEGITSYYEDRVMMFLQNETSLHRKPSIKNSDGFLAKSLGINQVNQALIQKNIFSFFSRAGRQQPMDLPAEEYGKMQYGSMVYSKTAQAFSGLEDYLGTADFDKSMQYLFESKRLSHIDKEDIRSAFEKNTGISLSWFFDGLLSAKGDPDYVVTKLEKQEGAVLLTLENKSGIAAPIYAAGIGKRSEGYPVGDTTVIAPFSFGEKVVKVSWNGEKMIGIDPLNTSLDEYGCNNYIKTRGLFRKMEPLWLQWLAAPEDPRRKQLFFSPVMAGNKADKLMLGMAFYNRVFPAKDLEWSFVPMYAFGSKQFTWLANINYYGHPLQGAIREWSVGGHGKSFTIDPDPVAQQFFKAEPHVSLLFRGKSERSTLKQSLTLRHISIWEQSLAYSSATDYRDTSLYYWVNEAKYTLTNQRALNPYNASASVEHNLDWLKFSAEGRFRINLGAMKKYFSVRTFIGAFLYKNKNFRPGNVNENNPRFAHTLSGTTGENDYLYDQTFLGRNFDEKLAGAQIAMTEGQFKVTSLMQNPAIGQTFDWLMALNIRLDAPVKWLPLQLFADIGYCYNNSLGIDLPNKGFQYDVGLALSLMDGAIEAYLPFAMSDDFRAIYDSQKPKFFSRITFSIDINRLNPHKMVRTLFF